MKKTMLTMLMCLSALTFAVNAAALTNLTVVRRADKTLWSQRCNGVGPTACDPWTKISGLLASQPSLTWDASIGKYIMIGLGSNNSSVWKATFNADGTFNNDWKEVKGASSATSSASSVSLAASGTSGIAWKGEWDASATYGVNDVVSDAGSSFISLIAGNTGNMTSDVASWGVVAVMGAAGVAGSIGPQGNPGTVGPKGPTGDPGPVGTIAAQNCPDGHVMTGVDSLGTIICTLASVTDLSGYRLLMPQSGEGKKLIGAKLVGAIISGDLSGFDFSYADLSSVEIIATSPPSSTLDSANLTGANLTNVYLSNLNMTNSNFTNANLTNAEFYDSNLTSANFYGANLTNAILYGANLTDANLTNIIWNATRCPDGTYSSTNGSSPQSCVGHLNP